MIRFIFVSIFLFTSYSNYAQSHTSFFDSCSIDSINGEEVYEIVDEPPEYPGGTGAFYKIIGKHIKISDKNKKMGYLKDYILFIIDPNGEIVYQCSIDGTTLPLEYLEKWKPGVMKGKKVYVKMVLPIKIKLG
ncbi:hypothetical protein [Flammeovirga sp. SJP92]|uniref:hypothetical protein n=1 Tax=Flammeovirga sp. SJP92 TaxID=1775430 RepID=UPI000787EAE8|nr:hypothetical protein [Flammeovirga sp. SJP92]KXX69508.1 hypothetical protein AVL50_15665 [Flammeovirga sp. SJP92]